MIILVRSRKWWIWGCKIWGKKWLVMLNLLLKLHPTIGTADGIVLTKDEF